MQKVIIKFFKDRNIVDSFLNGMFWCNTPEFYRQEEAAGVSDINESCSHSYRSSRDGQGATLEVNGVHLAEITDSTMYSDSQKDRWLHSWFELSSPSNDSEYINVVQDINRMRKEFGKLYLVILEKDFDRFLNRVKSVTELNAEYKKVSYSDNRFDWDCTCKSTAYAYQREFRFLVGNCTPKEVQPQKLIYEGGFRDIISDCQPIFIHDENTGELLLELTSDSCKTSLIT